MNGVLADTALRAMQIGQEAMLAGFLVFLRVGAAMAVLPVFGEQSVPMRVRLALAVAFTIVTAPAVMGLVAPLVSGGRGIGFSLVTETLCGLVIGLAVRLFILALQMAGTIAAQSTSLAQFFGGAGVEPQPAISQLMVVAGMALAAHYGLHVRLAQFIVLSYDMLPPGVFPGAAGMAQWGLHQIARAVELAFSLAAPFVIASVIYNVALGIVNRAMPSLMVSFIGAPALALGGLVMLLLIVPMIMGIWITGLSQFFNDPFSVTR